MFTLIGTCTPVSGESLEFRAWSLEPAPNPNQIVVLSKAGDLLFFSWFSSE
jgi:hypothetical protein